MSSSNCNLDLLNEPGHRGDTAAALDLSAKRLYDLFFSCCGLVVVSPLLLLIAVLI